MAEVRHISSAVLRVAPERMTAVGAAVAALDGCEVALAADGKIVVLIEAETSGGVGERLTALALEDGVHSACMIYEQVETLASLRKPVSGEEA
jgi:nitrate reductase NapD